MPLIRDAHAEDAARIGDIYNHYVLHAVATFEESPVSREDMRARIEEVQSQFFWLVYEDETDGEAGRSPRTAIGEARAGASNAQVSRVRAAGETSTRSGTSLWSLR